MQVGAHLHKYINEWINEQEVPGSLLLQWDYVRGVLREIHGVCRDCIRESLKVVHKQHIGL